MLRRSLKTKTAAERPPTLASLADHLSNERTYLAYLRTAVALMSFGIAINRFSLFLQQSNLSPQTTRFGSELIGSEKLGIGMVALGMVLLVWAAVRYVQVLHQIERQDFRPSPRTILMLTGLVFFTGLSSVIWLVAG